MTPNLRNLGALLRLQDTTLDLAVAIRAVILVEAMMLVHFVVMLHSADISPVSLVGYICCKLEQVPKAPANTHAIHAPTFSTLSDIGSLATKILDHSPMLYPYLAQCS